MPRPKDTSRVPQWLRLHKDVLAYFQKEASIKRVYPASLMREVLEKYAFKKLEKKSS